MLSKRWQEETVHLPDAPTTMHVSDFIWKKTPFLFIWTFTFHPLGWFHIKNFVFREALISFWASAYMLDTTRGENGKLLKRPTSGKSWGWIEHYIANIWRIFQYQSLNEYWKDIILLRWHNVKSSIFAVALGSSFLISRGTWIGWASGCQGEGCVIYGGLARVTLLPPKPSNLLSSRWLGESFKYS